VRRREGYELYNTRDIIVKERRFSRLYRQRSREKRDRKIKELGRGNLPKRRGTETNLAGYRIRRKDGELPARRIGEVYEKHRERERQTSPKSKDLRYALAETDKQKRVRPINNRG
jgi:hypothetical protein